MVRVLIPVFMFLAFCNTLYARTVLVSIFNQHNISALVFSPDNVDYKMLADGAYLGTAHANGIVYVSRTGDRLVLRNDTGLLGSFHNVSFFAIQNGGEFSIRPVDPSIGKVNYHGNIELSVDFGRIKIVNEVEESLYLAGVVEAEAGIGLHNMYYQAQAIICRTYLYGNSGRHADEDFDLCDEVHCQVYKGRLTDNQAVIDAVTATGDMIITLEDSTIITAAFHSNCGERTVNSEDVWLVHRPYLRSVNDPFCRGKNNSSWQLNVDFRDWQLYLHEMGLEQDSYSTVRGIFDFMQPDRTVFYSIGGFNLPFRKIRSDWNLRSAFFDVIETDPGIQIILRGRGYGHGVGLCQEGAMEMAARGYNFLDILQFYYTNIMVISASGLF
jgi:stage II sporulation protein D